MKHIPRAVYRLNFTPQFNFSSGSNLSWYLSALGISDIYASPVFSARKGSVHGYDITDHNSLNPEIGGDSGFFHLIREMKDRGISWIQDFVPNHMAYDPENRLISDVFKNGIYSEYYSFFDFTNETNNNIVPRQILFPVLERYYWGSLTNREITLNYEESGLNINYKDCKIPLLIDAYSFFFSHRAGEFESGLPQKHPDIITFKGIIQSMSTIPLLSSSEMRVFLFEFIRKTLWDLYTGSSEFQRFVDDNIIEYNGIQGDAESFSMLHSLLEKQAFRLAYWKVATEELNYRRFFTINSLISLKVEDEQVFSKVHLLIFRMIKEGWVSGMRIDHADGLYDPLTYLTRIREFFPDIYLIVEKILQLGENIPENWPVDGTTGYDFLNLVNNLFCFQPGRKKIDNIYKSFTGRTKPSAELVTEKKRLVLEKHMVGDIENLAHLFKKLSDRMKEGSDITLYGMKKVLQELIAAFPVYRTYIRFDEVSHKDKAVIEEALHKANENNPDFFHEFNFLKTVFLQKENVLTEEEKNEITYTIMKFQQYTGVAMAKGFEDSALYSYNRLISLNEVGVDLEKFGVSLDEFHAFNSNRIHKHPHTLNATTTHDTKRGEDVRARINVLSEIPREWEITLRRWAVLNKKFRTISLDTHVPSANDEYFLYQTLVGTFPLMKEKLDNYFSRLTDYLIKAAREAKDHTTWIKPNAEYEKRYLTFLSTILDQKVNDIFLSDVRKFSEKIAFHGIVNSLSQTILKITSPGIPDIYQGTETWSLCMVDPDNRREVDFAARIEILHDIIQRTQDDRLSLLDELWRKRLDGRIKMFVIYLLLSYRKEEKGLFEDGEYIPFYAQGTFSDNIVAFARKKEDIYAIIIVPRFVTKIMTGKELSPVKQVWKNTCLVLPDGYPQTWVDLLSGKLHDGRTLIISELFTHFPGAVLTQGKTVY